MHEYAHKIPDNTNSNMNFNHNKNDDDDDDDDTGVARIFSLDISAYSRHSSHFIKNPLNPLN